MAKKYKIFHLDDDPEILNFTKALFLELKEVDYEGFSEVKKFLPAITKANPELCLIDLNLGKFWGAGFEVIEAIRKKIGQEIALIVLSKRKDIKDITYALEIGADDYFTKPIDRDLFISKIRSYMENFSKLDEGNFPFKEIPSFSVASKVEYSVKPVNVDEQRLYVLSSHMLAKGTQVLIEGEFITKLMGVDSHTFYVHQVEVDVSTGKYIVSLDHECEDTEKLNRINNWLLGG